MSRSANELLRDLLEVVRDQRLHTGKNEKIVQEVTAYLARPAERVASPKPKSIGTSTPGDGVDVEATAVGVAQKEARVVHPADARRPQEVSERGTVAHEEARVEHPADAPKRIEIKQ